MEFVACVSFVGFGWSGCTRIGRFGMFSWYADSERCGCRFVSRAKVNVGLHPSFLASKIADPVRARWYAPVTPGHDRRFSIAKKSRRPPIFGCVRYRACLRLAVNAHIFGWMWRCVYSLGIFYNRCPVKLWLLGLKRAGSGRRKITRLM